MATLKLNPDPQFKASVDIPVAGGKPSPVEFVFKHRTVSQLDEFVRSREDVKDIDTVMDLAAGWNLTDEFNRENVETLLQNYGGAAMAIYNTYIEELVGARRKN